MHIFSVLQSTLAKNFEHVQVDVEVCPDLRAPPYSLAADGLGTWVFVLVFIHIFVPGQLVHIAAVGGWANFVGNGREKVRVYTVEVKLIRHNHGGDILISDNIYCSYTICDRLPKHVNYRKGLCLDRQLVTRAPRCASSIKYIHQIIDI